MSARSAPAAGACRRALLPVLPLLAAALILPGDVAASARADSAAPPGGRPAAPLLAEEEREEELVGRARELFDRYVALERDFDPAAADLFSDDAVIRNRRISATGEERILTLPAPQYKEILRKVMPLARLRGDVNRYSGTRFLPEGGRVRILTTRYSVLKEYESPLSLLVGPGKDGRWLVLEELSVSRQLPRPEGTGPTISPVPTPPAP